MTQPRYQHKGMSRLALLRFFFLLFLLSGMWEESPLWAQISEAQARALLAEKNIPEDTLRARLIKKGFNPDNIRPSELDAFQKAVVETISEIEASRQRPNLSPEPQAVNEPAQIVDQTPASQPPAQLPNSSSESDKPTAAIYGQEIFRNNSIAVYKTSSDAVVPEDYVLDTGDEIGVIGFGKSQFEQKQTITIEGFFNPGAGLPKILLKGLTWRDAKEVLFQRYSQYYDVHRGEFQATLIRSRNMTINVFGEAKTTGAITLPGINNAFNVISAAGGPTDIGSVRRIKIIRGKQVIPLDVYEFMTDPSVATNFYLRNNDYIHIPVAQKVVTIQGAVVRPRTYELLEAENLIQLISFAGGAKPSAYLTDVQITRYLDDKKIITNVNLRELMMHGGDYVLVNGDVVQIKTVDDATAKFVSIQGAVSFPGNYENRPGMRISDLVKQAVLKPDARLDFAYLLRYQPDGTYQYHRINLQDILDHPGSPVDPELNNQDLLDIVTLQTYAEQEYFSVEGAVKKADKFTFSPEGHLRLEDAILLAGGLEAEADGIGYVLRHNPKEPKRLEYISVDFEKAMSSPASDANIEIKSGDVIRVFDKTSRRDEYYVSVFGAVRHPGNYAYGPEMKLGDLINLAGGLTFEADSKRIDVARTHVDTQNPKTSQITTELADLSHAENAGIALQPFDHVYVRSIPEFEYQQTVSVAGEVRYPGSYTLLEDNERISDLIERAGGITRQAFPEGAKLYRHGDSTGLVVIDLDRILQNKNVPSNVVLLRGDVLQIPKNRDLVTIEGYVNLENAYSPSFLQGEGSISVAFRGEKSAKYYVDKFAAGVSENGAAREIKVQYADGRVQKTSRFIFFNNFPKIKRGSHIIVGAKEIRPAKVKEESKTDWSSVLRDTMAQATAVLTLLILVDTLSK